MSSSLKDPVIFIIETVGTSVILYRVMTAEDFYLKRRDELALARRQVGRCLPLRDSSLILLLQC